MIPVQPRLNERIQELLKVNPPSHIISECTGAFQLFVKVSDTLEQYPFDNLSWRVLEGPDALKWKAPDNAWIECPDCKKSYKLEDLYGSLTSEIRTLLQFNS